MSKTTPAPSSAQGREATKPSAPNVTSVLAEHSTFFVELTRLPRALPPGVAVKELKPDYFGLVATRDFHPREVVFSEQPWSVLRRKDKDIITMGHWSGLIWWTLAKCMQDYIALLRASDQPSRNDYANHLAAFKDYTEKAQKAMVRVEKLYPRTSMPQARSKVDALQFWHERLTYNAQACYDGGMAMYDTLSHINHACKPNVYAYGDPVDTVHVVTLHPIKKGDELTMIYAHRQKLPCTCKDAMHQFVMFKGCVYCHKQNATQFCGRCKTSYCSRACQEEHWSAHKTFCKLSPKIGAFLVWKNTT